MITTRRDFIKNTFALIAAGAAAPLISPRSALAQAAAQGAAPKNRRLVLVQMQGGNDGINTVIPYKDPAYSAARTTLRYDSAKVLPITGTDLGFHPAMTGFRDLYDAGRLAIVQGVGYPQPNLSHFASTDIWETGDPLLKDSTGWAGRLLDEIHDLQGGLSQGIAISDQLPTSLISEKSSVRTMQDPSSFSIQIDDRWSGEKTPLLRAFSGMYAAAPQEDDNRRYARETANDTYASTISLQNALKTYRPSATYPNNDLARQLQSVAQMIIGGSEAQVYQVMIGGFDTHSNQLTDHGNALRDLSSGMTAFYADLQGHNLHEDVTTVTFSEFGRRVQQNNGGTDHGTASVLFVLGGSVQGGLYGNYPSLTNLDGGNLRYNMDFRSVYSALISNWMGADPVALLGGSFPPLGFLP
jgi:uncharacterized protein (DUF1501 family)